jgi:hypothetical protein
LHLNDILPHLSADLNGGIPFAWGQ